MRGSRSAIATFLAIGLLGGAGGVVGAQDGPITPVTGIRSSAEDVQFAEPVVDEVGVLHLHGGRIEQAIEWSDPRLPTTMILSGNTDVYGEQGDPNGGVVYTG